MKYIKYFEAKIWDGSAYFVLNKLGLKKENIKKLSSGDEGIAFLYEDKIYKVTSDSAEVELAYILQGKKLEHYVEIYDIFCYDMGEDYEDNINIATWSPRYYWIIIEEYVKTGGVGSEYGDAIRYFDNVVRPQNNFNFTPTELDQLIINYIKNTREEFYKWCQDGEEYDEYEDMELYYLKIIVELHLELQKYGVISAIDLKGSHLGYKDDTFKYFDLRLERGIDKDIRNIKRLN